MKENIAIAAFKIYPCISVGLYSYRVCNIGLPCTIDVKHNVQKMELTLSKKIDDDQANQRLSIM
jgi:hypothetical protein